MFLTEPEPSPERQALYDEDIDSTGYVMNLTRAWAWAPTLLPRVFDLMDDAAAAGGLTFRDKGILTTAMTRVLGDSYCALAWGNRLVSATDVATAAEVARGGSPSSLSPRDLEMAAWAGKLAADPNSTTQSDVDRLRAVGFTDESILAMTVYVSLRIAFSTVNDAVGAAPDVELIAKVPSELDAAIDFGRRP